MKLNCAGRSPVVFSRSRIVLQKPFHQRHSLCSTCGRCGGMCVCHAISYWLHVGTRQAAWPLPGGFHYVQNYAAQMCDTTKRQVSGCCHKALATVMSTVACVAQVYSLELSRSQTHWQLDKLKQYLMGGLFFVKASLLACRERCVTGIS